MNPAVAHLAAILADVPDLPPAPELPDAVRSWREDIRTVDGWTQHIELHARPGDGRPRPALLCVHGGGWKVGSAAEYRRFARLLAWRHDVVVGCINYRLVDRARFPVQLGDAANGVRWLRAAAARLAIDPARIGVVGSSAGGYLSAMIALTHDDDRLAGSDRLNGESAAVQALSVHWGPLDFIARWYGNGGRPGAEQGLLGTVYTSDPAIYHFASALAHPRADAPPALFIFGDNDPVVHPQQGELALAAWQRLGVPAELLRLPWIGHVTEHAEDRLTVRESTAAFFARQLGLRANPAADPSLEAAAAG